jgi:hypothetical protein
MTMGQKGMGDMGDMGMAIPPNSIPMVGGKGPHDYITMGGMFTILKVRETLTSYDDPGWYKAPGGTQADLASAGDLRRDGISARGQAATTPTTGPATVYTCPMHPEVIAQRPGRCPKCGMSLVPK